jgi:predicted nucleic-acid-binding Zn-ribbon protein
VSSTPLKVIEPVSKPIKEFQTVEDFNKYYSKHTDEINAINTMMLNKMFRIEGYHIGRKKGILVLNKWCGYNKYYTKKESTEGSCDRVTVLEEKVEQLTTVINEIINRINNL